MAFKSTSKRNYIDIIREIEATGGNVAASASREQMGYSYDVLKTYASKAVELLVDSVCNPIFLDNEIKEQASCILGWYVRNYEKTFSDFGFYLFERWVN